MNEDIYKILIDMQKDHGMMMGEIKGINQRLDKLNGSVIRHETYIQNHKGKASVWGIMGGVFVTVVGWVINSYLRK